MVHPWGTSQAFGGFDSGDPGSFPRDRCGLRAPELCIDPGGSATACAAGGRAPGGKSSSSRREGGEAKTVSWLEVLDDHGLFFQITWTEFVSSLGRFDYDS